LATECHAASKRSSQRQWLSKLENQDYFRGAGGKQPGLTYIEVQCIMRLMLAKDLVAAPARPLLLSILADGESYGYEIIRRVRELSGGRIEWSDGMLYPVLHRLESEGLIRSEWKQAESGRDRKYYCLNGDGRKAIREERDQWLAVHTTHCKLWRIQPSLI
jgi:DNA-binding PadR family transcriptional regulator